MLWLYGRWSGLSLVAKVLLLANVIWAVVMLYGILDYETSCEGAACGWGFIFGGGAWLLVQVILLTILWIVVAVSNNAEPVQGDDPLASNL